MPDFDVNLTRREIVASAAVAGLASGAAGPAWPKKVMRVGKGWEWDPMRWIQICATDDDPPHYDKAFWIDLLRRTKTQGVCLSAGGVTAFYPTKVPYHYRSPYLGDTDMFGDLAHACKDMGVRVLGRIDPHAIRTDAVTAHPDWVALTADGTAMRHPTDPDLYLSCPNGPVMFEWMPQIIKEIVGTYPVDAIFGNRWAGSAGICHCSICKTEFKRASGGLDIPISLADPQDRAVRAYLVWDDNQRYAQLKLWTDTVQAINPEGFFTPGTWGRLDPKRLRTTIRAIYADRQGRSGQNAAWLNGRSAKEAYCLMQDRPMSGIFAVGETSTPYRWMDSVQSDAEVRAYLHDGLAQGFRPWMTKFKAEVFDKRWVPTLEKAYVWHAQNEAYFRNTENLARVAMVQSSQTTTYYHASLQGGSGTAGPVDPQMLSVGADDASNGFYQALVETRVPFGFADERQLDPDFIDRFKLLVLPNIAALSDRQCAQIRDYVNRGGAIVATDETSLYDEWGKKRANFGLADLFGCDFAGRVDPRVQNSYIAVRGPHPLTIGIDDTPRIMAGTDLVHVQPRPGAGSAPLTLVPSYPDLPMERAFPKVRETGIPMVYARTYGKGRVVYFPFNLDKIFWVASNQDHLALLRNAVMWAANETAPMTVAGAGLIDVSYWRQEKSLAAHLVNLNNPMAMKGFMREIMPIGPFEVSLSLPPGARAGRIRLLEAGVTAETRNVGDRLVVQVARIDIHEVVAIDLV